MTCVRPQLKICENISRVCGQGKTSSSKNRRGSISQAAERQADSVKIANTKPKTQMQDTGRARAEGARLVSVSVGRSENHPVPGQAAPTHTPSQAAWSPLSSVPLGRSGRMLQLRRAPAGWLQRTRGWTLHSGGQRGHGQVSEAGGPR